MLDVPVASAVIYDIIDRLSEVLPKHISSVNVQVLALSVLAHCIADESVWAVQFMSIFRFSKNSVIPRTLCECVCVSMHRHTLHAVIQLQGLLFFAGLAQSTSLNATAAIMDYSVLSAIRLALINHSTNPDVLAAAFLCFGRLATHSPNSINTLLSFYYFVVDAFEGADSTLTASGPMFANGLFFVARVAMSHPGQMQLSGFHANMHAALAFASSSICSTTVKMAIRKWTKVFDAHVPQFKIYSPSPPL
jgi:hypothetical protein